LTNVENKNYFSQLFDSSFKSNAFSVPYISSSAKNNNQGSNSEYSSKEESNEEIKYEKNITFINYEESRENNNNDYYDNFYD